MCAKKKKHPRKLRILSHDIDIAVEDPGEWSPRDMGIAIIQAMSIKIRERMARSAMDHTLLHEIVHIIEKMSSLDLSEEQVDGLATGLYTLLRDNKDFQKNFLSGAFWEGRDA